MLDPILVRAREGVRSVNNTSEVRSQSKRLHKSSP